MACREYKKGLVKHVSTFLAAVKASLVKLGVDENRLHRIVEEVSTCLSTVCFFLACVYSYDSPCAHNSPVLVDSVWTVPPFQLCHHVLLGSPLHNHAADCTKSAACKTCST